MKRSAPIRRQLALSAAATSTLIAVGFIVPLALFVGGEEDRNTIWVILAALGVSLVLGATAIADLMGRRIVRPVIALADAADRIGWGDLTARAELSGPAEVVEVADTLNQVAERIDELLAAEREEVADLSHRLRTPVTALRLDIDGLPEGEEKERLVADVDALETSVDRLINEARRKSRRPTITIADLAGIARERVAFWLVLAEDQERACTRDIPAGAIPVASTNDELAAVLDALLGNVFAHTPEGTAFSVSVTPLPVGGGGRLVVEDDGPGLPSGDVLDRGTSGGGSTGLGLDIVRRTAEETGGGVEVGPSASGGARIVVTFGPPRGQPARGTLR